MLEHLLKMTIYKILFALGFERLAYKIQARKRLKKREILNFSINLTDHCNLNCKGCNHFAPIAEENYYSVDLMEKDFKRICELANGRIDRVGLIGGEPLLHPNLIDILNIAGKYFFGIDRLELTTNGILLLKQEHTFWETCKKNNIIIDVSQYPIKLPYKEMEAKARHYGVNFEYKRRRDGTAVSYMHKLPLNQSGTGDYKKNFYYCPLGNTCIALEAGRIYTCQMVTTVKHFNKYFSTNLIVSEKDYIDIYAVQTIEEIFHFLCKPIPFCRYCEVKNFFVENINYEQSKKQIHEWI